MKISYLNCFCSDEADSGNPAAVIQDYIGSDEKRQTLASDLYKSHQMPVTVFLDNNIIRFFYPTSEMEMCVHGSLAAAHLVLEASLQNECTLATPSGREIIISKNGHSLQARLKTEIIEPIEINFELSKTFLNLENPSSLHLEFPQGVYSVGSPKYLIPLNSIHELENLYPNFDLIKNWSLKNRINGLYVYAPVSSSKTDFIARAFNPKSGYNEDAATGVAVGALASILKFPYIQVSQGNCIGRPCKLIASYLNDNEIMVGGVVCRIPFKNSID